MKVKKGTSLLLSLCLALGLITFPTQASASTPINPGDTGGSIKSVIDRNTYLLDDGSVWSYDVTNGPIHEQYNFTGITSVYNSYSFYGWTEDGQVMGWSAAVGQLEELPQYSGVAEVVGDALFLKKDGTVYQGDDLVENMSGVRSLHAYKHSFAALLTSGEVWYNSGYQGKSRKVGTVQGATSLKVNSSFAAVLLNTGKVMLLDMQTDDQPREIVDNVTSMAWDGDTQSLLTVKKDGTVWRYDRGTDRARTYKGNQLSGLSNVEQIVYSPTELFVQQKDGTWLGYNKGTITPLTIPSMTSVALIVSHTDAAVGDLVKLNVEETYSNGYKLTRLPFAGEVLVDQPQVAELQGTDTLKVKGIGSAKISLQVGSFTAEGQLNVTSQEHLTGAVMLEGKVYLPIQSVFKILGGTVNVASSGMFTIQLGEKSIVLQKDNASVIINGESKPLKGKTQLVNGVTVIPADLLIDELSVGVTWNTDLKQAELLVGGSKVVIESSETAKIIKAADIGNLARVIGKSYWVNHRGEGERFSKVTISDIIVKKDKFGKSYDIEFRTANGKTYIEHCGASASSVTDLLNNPVYYFNYNPYQKYKWSQSTWNKIKAGKVDYGMTPTQVEFSWGSPTARSKEGNVEVWVYGDRNFNFEIVSFKNGKVISYT